MILMRQHREILSITVLVSWAMVVSAQTTDVSRCFQFTWLGPRYNNDSTFLNATCQDATRLADGIPCFQPLVVSYDGTWPDISYIWQNHLENASCILANNDICAKYTYYFDGHVENSTYMCTRAVDTEGQAITNGCYQQVNGSSTTRVCFCRSIPGAMPCNGAHTISSVLSLITFILVVSLLINKDFPSPSMSLNHSR